MVIKKINREKKKKKILLPKNALVEIIKKNNKNSKDQTLREQS